jgi:uncharacterized membrane protein
LFFCISENCAPTGCILLAEIRYRLVAILSQPNRFTAGTRIQYRAVQQEEHTMKAKATLFGHPVHPMLIVFPLGLLTVGAIFDIIYACTHNGHWADVSYWMIVSGIIGGLIAAVFGLIDWLGIPEGTRAKYIGLIHGLSNVVVVVLFIISWFMRRPDPAAPSMTAMGLGWIGIGIALFAGWLGGELVYRLNVGVEHGANLDAPNSLSGRPAAERVGRSASA